MSERMTAERRAQIKQWHSDTFCRRGTHFTWQDVALEELLSELEAVEVDNTDIRLINKNQGDAFFILSQERDALRVQLVETQAGEMRLKSQIDSLYSEIAHGDDAHRDWLLKKIKAHFNL